MTVYDRVANGLGLNLETVKDLFDNGWVLKEGYNEPIRFVQAAPKMTPLINNVFEENKDV